MLFWLNPFFDIAWILFSSSGLHLKFSMEWHVWTWLLIKLRSFLALPRVDTVYELILLIACHSLPYLKNSDSEYQTVWPSVVSKCKIWVQHSLAAGKHDQHSWCYLEGDWFMFLFFLIILGLELFSFHFVKIFCQWEEWRLKRFTLSCVCNTGFLQNCWEKWKKNKGEKAALAWGKGFISTKYVCSKINKIK